MSTSVPACRAVVFALCGGLVAITPAVAAPASFEFREPAPRTYVLSVDVEDIDPAFTRWLPAHPVGAPDFPVQLGGELMLQLKEGTGLDGYTNDVLMLSRVIAPNFYLLRATNTLHAATSAAAFATRADVLVSMPDMKRPLRFGGTYAPRPNDPLFSSQFNLENRSADGTPLGADINARSAWAITRGAGVTMAIGDSGIQYDQPDLEVATAGMPHRNYLSGSDNGFPVGGLISHGTSVAGLAFAALGNGSDIVGVAPDVKVVSGVIFGSSGEPASVVGIAELFEANPELVAVQNHSWSFSFFSQQAISPIEDLAISNAVHHARGGLGVVMVRSAGNNRAFTVNANDDEYTNDPRIITVSSVRTDGRAASYSNPGTCILVAAPSGDKPEGFPEPVSTGIGSTVSFSGTSAAAPQVSGIVALMLSVNPDLTYRDVQQILVFASRHFDFTDGNLRRNQAGLLHSQNVGFGVPDAGRAVRLAQSWPARPPHEVVSRLIQTNVTLPRNTLAIEVTGDDVPPLIASIPAVPGKGVHPADLTPEYELVDLGAAHEPVPFPITGAAALIERGTDPLAQRIQNAAQAGAALAIIAESQDSGSGRFMRGTDFVSIPAVSVGGPQAKAMTNYFATNATARVRARFSPAEFSVTVDEALVCEHVGLRVDTNFSNRGSLRITLTSPAGTESELQPMGEDFNDGPHNWTYWSTAHFFESSRGDWKIKIGGEGDSGVGSLFTLELLVHGVPITDDDGDGLDDNWEETHFQTLASGPAEDADGDGRSNMEEFITGTDPLNFDHLFAVHATKWSEDYVRLGWRSLTNRTYQVFTGVEADAVATILTNVPGRLHESEVFLPVQAAERGFFFVRETAD